MTGNRQSRLQLAEDDDAGTNACETMNAQVLNGWAQRIELRRWKRRVRSVVSCIENTENTYNRLFLHEMLHT